MLSYQAHITGGHYAIESVPANSSVTVDLLASSYNSYRVIPVRAFVANAGNSGNVSIKVTGSIVSGVPPFSNENIDIQGMPSLTVTNAGTSDIQIMIADQKMLAVAAGVFATLNVASAVSTNDIVNNFELTALTDIVNEGNEEGVTYTVKSGTKLTAVSKFGQRAISNTVNTNPDDSGLIIEKIDFFDMAQDFTLDFWIIQPNNNSTIFRIGAEQASLNNSITLTRSIGATTAALNFFGAITAGIGITGIGSSYQHVAITKIGTTVRTFVAGLLINTSVYAGSLKLDQIGLMYSGLNNATYACGLGKADGVRFLLGTGLWDSAFTPPTDAPV